MSKDDRGWIPDETDLDWIESLAKPLPAALAAHFEARSWLGGGRGSQSGAPRATAAIDIGARMRQMWRGTGT